MRQTWIIFPLSSVLCVLLAVHNGHSEGYNYAKDVIFLLDGSGSVGATKWSQQVEFTHFTIGGLDINQGEIRVGVVAYNSIGIDDFMPLSEISALESYLNSLTAPSDGSSAYQLGIEKAVQMLTSDGRPEVPHVIVVITDGTSNNQAATRQIVTDAKSDGIIIKAVGIGGSNTLMNELEEFVSTEDDLFEVENFGGLLEGQFIVMVKNSIQEYVAPFRAIVNWYNCKRIGAVCDGTCNENGTCYPCTTGNSGYDCSVVTVEIDKGSCVSGVTCGPYGTCWDDNGTPTCLCPKDRTGPNCATPVVNLTCEADRMSITVTPLEKDVQGFLSVLNQNDEACYFGGPTVTDLIDGECGGKKRRTFLFRQTDRVLTSVDFILETQCGIENTFSREVHSIDSIDLIPERDLINRSKGREPVDLDVVFVMLVNGGMLNGAVELSDTLTVSAYISRIGQENFVSLRFEGCVAKPSAGDVGVTFIAGGCPGDLERLMTAITVSGSQISYSFRPFKFDFSNTVIIQCSIKVCDIADNCASVSCGGGGGGVRKKRQAGNYDRVLSASYTIRDPLSTSEEENQEVQSVDLRMQTCSRSSVMVAIVIGLSTALGIVLPICIFLIFKIVLKRPQTSLYGK